MHKETQQPSLFAPRGAAQAGAFNVDVRLRALMSEAIRRSPKSREQLAEEMSFLLGRGVTERMLNDWTSPAHENHGIQARYLPALCEILQDDAPLEVLLEKRRGLADLLAIGRAVVEHREAEERVQALIARARESRP